MKVSAARVDMSLYNDSSTAEGSDHVFTKEEESRLYQKLFPEWFELMGTWERIDEVQNERKRIKESQLIDIGIDFNPSTLPLREELRGQEERLQQRVAVLKDDILHAKESLNRIEARMTQKDLLDQAAILISGRRVPPANPDMDWERETDGIMIETPKLEGRVSKAMNQKEQLLQDLHQRFNYEFVMFGMNQYRMSQFVMNTELGDEATEWIGSITDLELIEFRPLSDLAKARTEFLKYGQEAILKAWKAENESESGFSSNTETDDVENNEWDDDEDEEDEDNTEELNSTSDDESVEILTQDIRKLKPFCAVCNGHPSEVNCPNCSRGSNLRPEKKTKTRDNKEEKYYPNGGYDKPQYLCNVCYIGICGAVCKNRPSDSKVPISSIPVTIKSSQAQRKAMRRSIIPNTNAAIALLRGIVVKSVQEGVTGLISRPSPDCNDLMSFSTPKDKESIDLTSEESFTKLSYREQSVERAGSQPKPKSVGRSKIICSYCLASGHYEEDCWELHPCRYCEGRHSSSGCFEKYPYRAKHYYEAKGARRRKLSSQQAESRR